MWDAGRTHLYGPCTIGVYLQPTWPATAFAGRVRRSVCRRVRTVRKRLHRAFLFARTAPNSCRRIALCALCRGPFRLTAVFSGLTVVETADRCYLLRHAGGEAVRVLYITQGFPEDRLIGGQISSFYRIVQLARAGHEVTALCVVPERAPATSPVALEKIARVVAVRDVPAASPVRYAMNLLDPLPWPVRRYASRAASGKAGRILDEARFDLIFVNSVHGTTMLPAVRRRTEAPCLLFAPNVQSATLGLYARYLKNPAARAYALIQAAKMRAFEAASLDRFDLVLAYTESDLRGLRALAPRARIEVVPIALDVTGLADGERREDIDVLHISYLAWPPNRDSLRWFDSEILPRIRASRPGTTVGIVGGGAPAWAARLDDPKGGVRVYGEVEDAIPFFRRSRVLVVPLRIGTGVRVKIVQAMAAGTAVVTTSKGCEGLLGRDGSHYVIRDNPEEFAHEVVRLLESPGERRALAERARALASEEYDAMAPRPLLVRACERLAGANGGEDHASR